MDVKPLIQNQVDLIRALTASPKELAKYVHYTGPSTLLQFGTLTLHLPLIDRGDCCLLSDACPNRDVSPLGSGGAIGVPYLVQYPDGSTMVAKVAPLDGVFCQYRRQPPTVIRDGTNRDFVSHCLTDIDLNKIRYIASDEFTNETLIAYVLNYLASQQPIPRLFVTHYYGSICGNYGINMMENCDLGSLDQLYTHPQFEPYLFPYKITNEGQHIVRSLVIPSVLNQILTQITVGLHMLQTYINFTSGDLKAGNIFVKSEPIDTEYAGIKLQANFTCKVADYGKSSCMLFKSDDIQGIRFYNQNRWANWYLAVHPFTYEYKNEQGEYVYSIGQLLNPQIYTRTRHMGLPFYQSFDYYTVLVSMMTHGPFYYSFFATDDLRSIFWDPIWIDNSGDTAIRRIKSYIETDSGSSINDALDILKGLTLKCNAVDVVIQRLQNIHI